MSKKLFSIIGLVCFGTIGLASFASADVDRGVFQFEKPIILPADLLNEQYVKTNIDEDISLRTQPDLSDMRIVANGSTEVPYQLIVENESVRNESTQASVYDLSQRNGDTAFVVDIGETGRVHDHISVISDSQNYKRKVSVYASPVPLSVDHAEWRLVTSEGYIYNFHDAISGFDAGSGEVSYPANTSRYLKVVIQAGEGANVDVSSVKVFRLVAQQEKTQTREYPVMIRENKERKTTELVLDQGGGGVPTRQIVLHTNDTKNFNRRAVVQSSRDGTQWVNVGEGYLFSLHTPLFSGAQLTLPYRESRERYLRVVVMNEDDLAVSWNPIATLSGVVRSVVFQANPQYRYALYYGNAKAIAPHYDIARYFQYIESASLSYATLGGELPNTYFVTPPPPTIPFSERNANYLNGALVLLVAFMVFLTLSYVKKLKFTQRGPNEDGHNLRDL